MRDYWWVDSDQTGYYYNIEKEETIEVENVKDITRYFPGFYVLDPERGIETPNGIIVSVVEASNEMLEKEGKYMHYWLLDAFEESDYIKYKDGRIEFSFSDFVLYDSKDAEVISVIYELDKNSYLVSTAAIVLSSNQELRYYDFNNPEEYILLGTDVLPRTVSSNIRVENWDTYEYSAKLSWVDKNYTGYAITDIMKSSKEIKKYENVVDSNMEWAEGLGFKVNPNDDRLNIYQSYKNYFIINK